MRRFTPLFVLCALLAVEVRVAHAQTGQGGQTSRPGRPYRGLFGGGGSSEDPGQALSATVSFGGGYDDNLRAEASGGRGIGRDGTVQGGALGTLGGTLNYVSTGDRSSWSATLGASTRYYPNLDPHSVSSRNASIDTTRQLTSRTSLNLSASASYRPFWLGGLFATPDGSFADQSQAESVASDPTNLDQSGNLNEFLSYRGTLGLSQRLSARTTASAGYSYRGAGTRGYGGRFEQQMVRGGIQRQVTRDLGLNLGYAIRRSGYGSSRDRDDHLINIGINYNRALSFSRRTSLSFGTGSSALENDGRRIYRATGAASLTHELGQSWTASANYNRGLRFVETITAPIFADSASVVLAGLLNRRVDVTSSFQVHKGNLGGSNLDFRSTSVVVSYGLTRNVSLQTNYGYFQYAFGRGVSLPTGVPARLERQSIKVQVALWAPIFQRARRANASR